VDSGRDGPVRWLFTDREGGVSSGAYASLNVAPHVGDDPAAVVVNRERVARAAGVVPDRLVMMRAEHGARVAVAVGGAGEPPPADGLVTAEPGLAVAALAADCLPVVLYDADSGIVGAVHSGWIGLRDGAIGATVAAMRDLGAGELSAVVGPAICVRCYPVPAQRVEQVAAVVPEAAGRAADGSPAVDLAGGALATLAALGVRATALPICTAESTRHYSYRRDRTTGRHAGVVVVQA